MNLTVNGRQYLIPAKPVAVICVDGLAPDYITAAIETSSAPFFGSLSRRGFVHEGNSVLPSFTNPNNVSIVTGVPPSAHGISGNYCLDSATGSETMMNDPRFLRCGTILAAMALAGKRVGAITAKDKLRRMLGYGIPMEEGLHACFSIEKAEQTTLEENGIDDALSFIPRKPAEFYSTETSMAVLDAGIAMLERDRADILYLSTTDYIQHLYAPREPEALDFMSQLDSRLAAFDEMGCMIVLTADHGMNAKSKTDGTPNVLYLQQMLDESMPRPSCRVILPVTDPYVVHHGSLGSFATIYVDESSMVPAVRQTVAAHAAVDEVVTRENAASQYELPPDRIGDLCVFANKEFVFGTRPEAHDLSSLCRPLRSHGGKHEQRVPLVCNRPLRQTVDTQELRNFDAFHLACNGFDSARGQA